MGKADGTRVRHFLAVGEAAVYNLSVAAISKGPQRDLAQAGSLGFTLVALVLVFTGIGYLVDRWLHTRPWLMVAGVFGGFVLGFVYMVLVMFADSSEARDRKKRGNGDGGSDGYSTWWVRYADREGDLGLTLISVAIGLGLAVAYYAASLRFQLVVSKRPGGIVSLLTAAGLVIRLTVFAVILILLAVFTDLNILAVAVAFLGLFTVLQGVGMHRYVARSKRGRPSGDAGREGGAIGS